MTSRLFVNINGYAVRNYRNKCNYFVFRVLVNNLVISTRTKLVETNRFIRVFIIRKIKIEIEFFVPKL